jgi:hypothetical protein
MMKIYCDFGQLVLNTRQTPLLGNAVFNAVSAASFDTIKNLFDQWQIQIEALRKSGRAADADQIEAKMLLLISEFTQNITDATEDTKQQVSAATVDPPQPEAANEPAADDSDSGFQL